MKRVRQRLTIEFVGAPLTESVLERLAKTLQASGAVGVIEHEELGTQPVAALEVTEQEQLQQWASDPVLRERLQYLSEHFSEPLPLLGTLEEIAASGTPPALDAETFTQLRHAVTLVTEHYPNLQEVLTYAPRLPQAPVYNPLHMHYNMMRSHLHFRALLQRPSMVADTIMPGFVEFRRHYTAQYITEYMAYQDAVQALHDALPLVRRQLLTLQILEELYETPSPEYPSLMGQLEQFQQHYPVTELRPENLRRKLYHGPYIDHFVLGMPLPTQRWGVFTRCLHQELSSALHQIRQMAFTQLTTDVESTPLQKILDLIQLSNLDEIVALVNEQDNTELVYALRTLMGRQ